MNKWIKIKSKQDPYGQSLVYQIVFTDPKTGEKISVDKSGIPDKMSRHTYFSEDLAHSALSSFDEYIKLNSDIWEIDVS